MFSDGTRANPHSGKNINAKMRSSTGLALYVDISVRKYSHELAYFVSMVIAKICLLAQDVVTDAERKTVSVFHIVEELVAEGFPAALDVTALVIWERDVD